MSIVGHADQVRAFIEAAASGRLHHAWLLTGPRGIGKAAFAEAAARYTLAGASDDAGFSVPRGNPNVLAFDAGSHPDHRRIERRVNERGKLATEIGVEQVRELGQLLGQTPSMSDWRTIIVDSACEMNRAAANALLKALEEPPSKTLFLLVCHSPGRLLATIRSRCRALRFQPLGDAEVRRVLEASGVGEGDLDPLAAIANGAPGRALRFAGLDIAPLRHALERLERADANEAREVAHALARELGSPRAQARYEAFLELVPAFLAAAAKRGGTEALAGRLALWEEARDLAAAALPKYLDAAQTVFLLARIVGRLEPEARRAA